MYQAEKNFSDFHENSSISYFRRKHDFPKVSNFQSFQKFSGKAENSENFKNSGKFIGSTYSNNSTKFQPEISVYSVRIGKK